MAIMSRGYGEQSGSFWDSFTTDSNTLGWINEVDNPKACPALHTNALYAMLTARGQVLNDICGISGAGCNIYASRKYNLIVSFGRHSIKCYIVGRSLVHGNCCFVMRPSYSGSRINICQLGLLPVIETRLMV